MASLVLPGFRSGEFRNILAIALTFSSVEMGLLIAPLPVLSTIRNGSQDRTGILGYALFCFLRTCHPLIIVNTHGLSKPKGSHLDRRRQTAHAYRQPHAFRL